MSAENRILNHIPLLIQWFQKNKRDLPWRKNIHPVKEIKEDTAKNIFRDPYSVWIAEIMLQQTRVTVVMDYFKRWMQKFPTIKKLALAKEEEVLLLWQGLGYYSRARNILVSAKIIVQKYNGIFPKKHCEIISLKGIGQYTAGAICSIAYRQNKVLVDGNVERVMIRFLFLQEEIKVIRKQKIIWQILEKIIYKVPPHLFNEGLMEIGALICLPKNPKCHLCPLQKGCLSYEKQKQNLLPYKKKKQKLIKVFSSCFLISYRDIHEKNKNDFILLEKRISTSRLKNFWQFPIIEHHDKNLTKQEIKNLFFENYFPQQKDFLLQYYHFTSFKKNYSCQKIMNFEIDKLGEEKQHFYTKYKIKLSLFHGNISTQKIENLSEQRNNKLFIFPKKNIDKVPLTTISKKMIKLLEQ